MRLDKFTTKFQEALSDAQSIALGNDHAYIEPVHVLVAMLKQDDGPKALLQRAGANVQGLLAAAEAAVKRLPQVTGQDQRLRIQRLAQFSAVAGHGHVGQLGRGLDLLAATLARLEQLLGDRLAFTFDHDDLARYIRAFVEVELFRLRQYLCLHRKTAAGQHGGQKYPEQNHVASPSH